VVTSCRFRRSCAFFRNEMEYMPGTAGLYREKYCRRARSKCARYAVYHALGPQAVPSDLFPYQHDRAEAILAKRSPRISA
jgi:hypothetical protein